MQKIVTWGAQVVIVIALAMASSLVDGRGLSLLLAGMAGGVAVASLVGLGMRPPEDLPHGPRPLVARVHRDSGTTSISTLEG